MKKSNSISFSEKEYSLVKAFDEKLPQDFFPLVKVWSESVCVSKYDNFWFDRHLIVDCF